MAADSTNAKAAAADLARAAAAEGGTFDAQAHLERTYPGLAGAQASVRWGAEKSEQYRHHLVKEDGTVLSRPSTASSQRVDAHVTVERPFVTPLALALAPLAGAHGYAVDGTGTALRDTTVESGRW